MPSLSSMAPSPLSLSAAAAPSRLLLLLLSVFSWRIQSTHGYPLIAQVSEQQERCFKFNIPEDDDAHLVFLALPLGEEISQDSKDGGAKLEGWLVQEVLELSNKRVTGGNMPTALLNQPPPELRELMDKYVQSRGNGNNLSNLKVIVSVDSNNPASRVLPIKYFTPTVINKVRESHKRIQNAQAAEGDDDGSLSGYGICFNNKGNEDESVQVIMDIVMLNADPDGAEANEPNFVKEKHLSPLEESLEKSIKAANTVLREMKYMTDREERMRHTADSINQRVQYFSIISVVILLGVTYIQVTYLKRYFKKKKLM